MTHRTEEQLDLFDSKFNTVVTDAEPSVEPKTQQPATVVMQDCLTSISSELEPEPFFAIWIDSLPKTKTRTRRSSRKHSA